MDEGGSDWSFLQETGVGSGVPDDAAVEDAGHWPILEGVFSPHPSVLMQERNCSRPVNLVGYRKRIPNDLLRDYVMRQRD